MAYRQLASVLREFKLKLDDSRNIARDASRWVSSFAPGAKPFISHARQEQMNQLAFLLAFLAWEGFLQDTFVLYLVGQLPPKGKPPTRYAFPSSLKAAEDWLLPEERPFSDWTNPEIVSKRANRFFRDGKPYAPALSANQNTLREARVLRNAVVHQSEKSQLKFEMLVREKLGVYPYKLTVGGFLFTRVPSSKPPITFLDSYLNKLEFVSQRIVPV